MATCRRYCRLRKCIAAIFVLFVFSVCATYLMLSGDEYDELYSDIDGAGLVPGLHFQYHADYGGNIVSKDGMDQHERDHVNVTNMTVPIPVLLWWTPLTGERGRVKTCGAAAAAKCLLTVDRHFRHHPSTRAFLFYGTDFRPADLPLPRRAGHQWALLHEESPKNNYLLAHADGLALFNHTSTFRRESDAPLTTQYLRSLADLTDDEYLVPTERKSTGGLAPVVYIHSDCDPPSDRDSYVRELMRHIPVDSYGRCLHNKDLPAELVDPLTMDHEALYRILARYKFTLAFENAVCDDYITEKLWRPLRLGSVPVYRGAPSVRDWLPDNSSAILADDFAGPKELAAHLTHLAADREAYDAFLAFKSRGVTNKRLLARMTEREWGVNDVQRPNFIDTFECMVCKRVHENLRRESLGLPARSYRAARSHLNCPRPQTYTGQAWGSAISIYLNLFDGDLRRAKALRRLVESGRPFSQKLFKSLMNS